jgi:hypothetical protein
MRIKINLNWDGEGAYKASLAGRVLLNTNVFITKVYLSR